MGRHDLEGAAMEFKRVLQIDPKYYPARNNLGSAYIGMGRYRDAINILKPLRTEEMYPTPYLAEGNIGWAWHKLNDEIKAEEHLKRAVFLNPKFCLGFDELGIVFYTQKRFEDAMVSFEQATKKCKKFAEPYLYMGMIHEKLGDMNAAVKSYKKCVELGGRSRVGRRCKARLGE
jgi:Tfp pilus assembly protein PilF